MDGKSFTIQNIFLEEDTPLKIRLVSVTGQLILGETYISSGGANPIIQLPKPLPNGIYLIRVEWNNQAQIFKLVAKKNS